MSRQAIDDTSATIQQILDQDYAHLEWRVLSSQLATSELPDEPFVLLTTSAQSSRPLCAMCAPTRERHDGQAHEV